MVIKEKVIKPEWEPLETGDILLDSFVHLKTVGRIVNRDFTSRLTKLGLPRVNFCIIYQLRQKFGSSTPTMLSKRIYVNKHNISQAITELEKDGIVKRTINNSDNRTTIITLTNKGKQYADKIITDVRKLSRRVMSVLSEEELQTLDKMMTRIRYHYLLEILDQ